MLDLSRKGRAIMSQRQPAQIRGAFFANIANWVKEAYGEEVYLRAVARLDQEDQALLQKKILTSGWYPVSFTERFANACRAEVLVSVGEDEKTFNHRNIREAGGRIMQSLYKFVLSWLDIQFAIGKIPTLFSRIYDQGKAEVTTSTKGSCKVVFSGPPEMTESIKSFGPGSVDYIIELAGAKPKKVDISTFEKNENGFLIEVSAEY
jgi:hypothetical protein